MKTSRPDPNPFAQFFVAVALMGALYMAIEGLVYESEIVGLLPPNADMSWSHAFEGSTPLSPASHGGK